MDPDFAGLEFPRFTQEDSQVTEQNAAPAPAPKAVIPWLGNLYGAIQWPWEKAAPAVAIPGSTAAPPSPSLTPAPAPAAAPQAAPAPTIVNVFGNGKKKPKAAKPEGEAAK